MKHFNFETKVIFGLAVIALTVAYFSIPWGQLSQSIKHSRTNRVACTMEARQCPDGSYVGRIPPKCEFAACSSTNSVVNYEYTPVLNATGTYSNVDVGFQFSYTKYLKVYDGKVKAYQRVEADGTQSFLLMPPGDYIEFAPAFTVSARPSDAQEFAQRTTPPIPELYWSYPGEVAPVIEQKFIRSGVTVVVMSENEPYTVNNKIVFFLHGQLVTISVNIGMSPGNAALKAAFVEVLDSLSFITTDTPTSAAPAPLPTSWKIARIADLGITFEYPARWGTYSVVNAPVEKGKSKNIYFSSSTEADGYEFAIYANYVSAGFESGRSGSLAESFSYHGSGIVTSCANSIFSTDRCVVSSKSFGTILTDVTHVATPDQEAVGLVSFNSGAYPFLSFEREYRGPADLQLIQHMVNSVRKVQ